MVNYCVTTFDDYLKAMRNLALRASISLEQPDHPLRIKKVIFNNPATIVWWNDGTNTVVRCQKGDTYSAETGLAMAICKKAYGNGTEFNKVFTKWLPHDEV